MKPLWIACRKCAAQPNDQCFDGWMWDEQVQDYRKLYRDGFHEERVFDAGTFNSSAVHVDKKIIERAAEDLV